MVQRCGTNKFIQNRPLIVFGSGEHIRDYIYVSDIVDFTLSLINLSKSHIFNVGRGVPVTVNELFNVFQEQNSKAKKPVYKPERHGEIGNFYADISYALETGWKWKVTLKEGVSMTISAFKDKNR